MSSESDLMLDVGLANELKLAARRAGATSEDIKWLTAGENLSMILPVIKGWADVVSKKNLIDCDADPFVPDGWKVEEHTKGGQLEWNPDKISLHLSKKQKGGVIKGKELRQELKGKPVMNARVLDYLLAHPHLIPEEWKGKAIFFWGTIYCDSDGDLCVRYIHWLGDSWRWLSLWLSHLWPDGYPAVLAK